MQLIEVICYISKMTVFSLKNTKAFDLQRFLSRQPFHLLRIYFFMNKLDLITSASRHINPCRSKTAIKKRQDFYVSCRFLVQSTGLEPVPFRTRPSNVRVCQFRHDCKYCLIRHSCLSKLLVYYTLFFIFCQYLFKKFHIKCVLKLHCRIGQLPHK